jgi:hypothetical protein
MSGLYDMQELAALAGTPVAVIAGAAIVATLVLLTIVAVVHRVLVRE